MKQEIALSMMNEDYFFNFMSLRTISVRDDTCHEDKGKELFILLCTNFDGSEKLTLLVFKMAHEHMLRKRLSGTKML